MRSMWSKIKDTESSKAEYRKAGFSFKSYLVMNNPWLETESRTAKIHLVSVFTQSIWNRKVLALKPLYPAPQPFTSKLQRKPCQVIWIITTAGSLETQTSKRLLHLLSFQKKVSLAPFSTLRSSSPLIRHWSSGLLCSNPSSKRIRSKDRFPKISSVITLCSCTVDSHLTTENLYWEIWQINSSLKRSFTWMRVSSFAL